MLPEIKPTTTALLPAPTDADRARALAPFRQEQENTAATLKRIAAELRALFPCKHWIELHTAEDPTHPRVVINGQMDYAEGTALLRNHGIGTRSKEVYDADLKWTKISGETDGVTIEAWADGLPPTCRLVTEKVKIPKQQTVDTGEFIEIEKTRVVCGQPEAV